MRYTEKTFTCPAGPAGKTQREWDYAMLTRDEFLRKYPEACEYGGANQPAVSVYGEPPGIPMPRAGNWQTLH